MKSTTSILFAIAAALVTVTGTAQGQVFGPSTYVTTDTDVLDLGSSTTALAFDLYDQLNSSTTTVNNVTFSGDETGSGGVTLSITGYGNNGGIDDNNGVTKLATMSQGYANILTQLSYGANPGTLTFGNLTAGDTYELQVFAGSQGAFGTETYTDPTTIPGPTPPSPSGGLNYGYGASRASYVTETFTAPLSGTETIDVTSGNFTIFEAVNLQDMTEAPEPSTFALVLGGAGALLLVRRLRGKLNF